MNKNNLFLFFTLLSPAIAFSAGAPGKNVLQTSHSVNFDSKGFGEALGVALAKTQVGVNVDYKALGEALAKQRKGAHLESPQWRGYKKRATPYRPRGRSTGRSLSPRNPETLLS